MSMNTTKNKLIMVCWILSILILAISITDLALRVVKNQTGIALEYFYPFCNYTYFNIKYSFTYRSFLVEFIALALSTLSSVVAFIALFIPFKQICCRSQQDTAQPIEGHNPNRLTQTEVQVHNQLLYIMSALVLFSWVVIGGTAIQYQVQGKYCLTISNSIQKSVMYISMAGLGLAFLFYIMILILIYQRNPLSEPIKMNQITKKKGNSLEDNEISYRMEEEAKNYIASMSQQRDQTNQGMMGFDMNQDYLNYWKLNSNYNQVNEPSQYTYYEEEVVVQNEEDLDKILNDKMFVGIVEKKKEPEPLQNGEPKSVVQSQEGESSKEPSSPLKDTPERKESNAKLLKLNKNALVIKGNSSKIVEEQDMEEQSNEQEKGQKLLEDANISEENKKILKVLLFKNSSFFHSIFDEPPTQSECPIQKYLQRDEKEQITQNDFKFKGKNKKNLYEKEQLYFEKKKKQIPPTAINQFDESVSIRKSRLERFGQQWVKERQMEEKLLEKEVSARFKKRQGLDSIRSKFYH